MTRFTKVQKVTMVALIVALLLNPLSFEVLLEYFRMASTGLSLLATAWVVGFLGYKVFRPERVNIPKKSTKKSTTKFIET